MVWQSSRCKARKSEEEAPIQVRRNDEVAAQRRRWTLRNHKIKYPAERFNQDGNEAASRCREGAYRPGDKKFLDRAPFEE
jgi:hypothetical protein